MEAAEPPYVEAAIDRQIDRMVEQMEARYAPSVQSCAHHGCRGRDGSRRITAPLSQSNSYPSGRAMDGTSMIEHRVRWVAFAQQP